MLYYVFLWLSLHAAWLAEYYAPNHAFAQLVGADGCVVGRDRRGDMGSVGSDSLSLYSHRCSLRGRIGDRSPWLAWLTRRTRHSLVARLVRGHRHSGRRRRTTTALLDFFYPFLKQRQTDHHSYAY